jgi:F-type H+-transporting ATPase subunit O
VAGSDKGDILKNFLNTLAENNRLGLLEGVVDKFATLMSAHRGEIELIITSAQVRTLTPPSSFSLSLSLSLSTKA